jgi:hypothetical protein
MGAFCGEMRWLIYSAKFVARSERDPSGRSVQRVIDLEFGKKSSAEAEKGKLLNTQVFPSFQHN